jgi:hypothetical protein
MSQKQTSAYCPYCDRQTLAIGTKPNHLLHLVLSICTAGVWLVVWLLVAIGKIGGYRCSKCGTRI